jgi:radical SAM protein with 4Fe4S-binding SPASM domain
MKIGNQIYNLVLYNRSIKQIAIYLLKNRLLVKNPVYNFCYAKLIRKKMQKFEDIPFRVMIENTNACNANCTFCPHKIMRRKTGIMDTNLSKRIIDECKNLGIDYITIYGFGEPLLDPYIFERVAYAKSKGIARVTTNTNAMYLNNEKVKRLLESGIDEVYISFDAATEITYRRIRPGLNFEIVEQNILALIQEKKERNLKKPEIIMSFVESSANKHEVKQYIQKWKSKADNVSISAIHNWTGDIESSNENSNGLRRDPCRLLWADMVISWNGDVPLCCNDYENKIILGNVKNQSIKEIWGGEKPRKIRELHKGGEFEKLNICAQCEYNLHHKSPWWVAK